MSPGRVSRLFRSGLLFFVGGFCGYYLSHSEWHSFNLTAVSVAKSGPDSIKAPSGYEVKMIMRRLRREEEDIPTKKETPCKCTGQRLSDHLSPSELANKQKELAASLERFEKRRIDLRDVYNQVEGSSPISYPAHGVYCRPRRTVRLKVRLQYAGFNETIPIHVQQVQLPWLYDPKGGKFQDRVTVVVKTFLRYSNLKRLIASIHELYPGTRMVIADDTPSELFTSVQAPNVDQFQMPEKTGYFAGRNLGLSQVSTEYFVYADDDHFIRNDTRLDMFVSLLDKTNFHLVSSKIEDESWRFSTTFEITGDNGDSCLVEQFKTKHFHEIPGFPGCYANEKGENFFMASTNEMKSTGFDPDPALSRIGHEELFFSALGRLRTAACRNNVVGHNRTGPEFKQAHYERFRRPGKETKALKSKYSLLKHNLACTQIGPHRRGNRTEAKPKK
ncbi:beta-1,4 N-acetylgalactosaminyltransferase 2-like [Branchiostoma floridae]|uniref:Beta-1,4 N-acetylgalactosaminyltransferase 2-like n=1 Tax=Branchiostoma floridae TaxID=7739 RepID=A0A9J7NBI2_BRAFL|nr:beta-1,4 N-acetylgalactosaminyltransferase 2-like [Branchiostoma floridae]